MRDVMYIRFDRNRTPKVAELGLSLEAINRIFLGPTPSEEFQLALLPGCPEAQAVYQQREFRASRWSRRFLEQGLAELPSPFCGTLKATRVSKVLDKGDRALSFLPVMYEFGDGHSEKFVVVTSDLTGRIVYLFVPHYDLVVYEISLTRAETIHNIVRALCLDYSIVPSYPNTKIEIVALVDMVTNFGHQMINHLSALDDLIDADLLKKVDEIWVCGNEFFGATINLYPELKSRLTCFRSRSDVVERAKKRACLVVRLGSNRFHASTRNRLLTMSSSKYQVPIRSRRFPLIAINVRTQGRRCENLGDVVSAIYEELIVDYPELGFVLDGWAFKNYEIILNSPMATCLESSYSTTLKLEFAAVKDAFRGVPPQQ